MSDLVAILEDNAERIAVMRSCLAEALPGNAVVFFENAAEMIGWLDSHLGEILFISLDHDLPLRIRDGKTQDCGTGRQIADHLATFPPTCPIIVHSSNNDAAQAMVFTLHDAGWPCERIYPCDDTAWIAEAWIGRVRRFIGDGWLKIPQ